MLTTIAIVTALVAGPTVTRTATPQCQYYRYMTAGIWTALDDAERAGASRLVTNNIETTLRDAVQRERKACK
ncbi:hypothetical protein [Ensifer aridi]|uniref:hypothetical protein n=1 Tax=Ensifer aridi TaxID=1708715 RepID=UPI000A0FF6AE|nr:hypothetical protein [Ensifer aridi]